MRLDPATVQRAMGRLEDDLMTGAWQRRHADLLERDEMDAGYRLVISSRPDAP